MNINNCYNLSEFANPNSYQEPLRIENTDPTELKSFLRDMLYIRKVEQQLAKAKREGLIGGPVHLGVGQEAVAVGVSCMLSSKDRVFGAHRSHSHLLALTREAYPLFAEIMGKVTGHSKGMGGSMHLWAEESGFYGSVPIVAGTVPLAVGAGLAAKLQENKIIAISYLGDGAMEEGIVHESLNLAKIQQIPVIFVVENNLFASHMHISMRQPKDATSRFAVANGIPYDLVDGNDVIQVRDAVKKLIETSRNGDGPGFLEAVTYRWYGHVDWREDIDVGVNRSREDLKSWKLRDPIQRLEDAMKLAGIWSEKDHFELSERLDHEIKMAWNMAMEDPYPDQKSLLEEVYRRK